MRPLNWTYTKERHRRIRNLKLANLAVSVKNRNENWMYRKLLQTGYKWKRQAEWGYRIFDFWCHDLGVAVEVDGNTHDAKYDAYRDEYNFRRSAIVVLRVHNMDEIGADRVLHIVSQIETWRSRRTRMGLFKSPLATRKKLTKLPYPPSLLKKYIKEIDKDGHNQPL